MRKSIAFTEEEVQYLLSRLGDDPFRLRGPLTYLLQQMSDDAEKLRELTARLRANQHWVNEPDPTTEDNSKPRKTERKPKKERLLDDAIAKCQDLSTADRDAVLKALGYK